MNSGRKDAYEFTDDVDYNALWETRLQILKPEHKAFVDQKIREAIEQGRQSIIFAGTHANCSALEIWTKSKKLRVSGVRLRYGYIVLPGEPDYEDEGNYSMLKIEWGKPKPSELKYPDF